MMAGWYKTRIKGLLASKQFSEIVNLDAKPKSLIKVLLGLLYEKDPMISWRAVQALGLVLEQRAGGEVEVAREVIRRLLWSLNDESGGTGWYAPQAMGAVIATRPEALAEYIPIMFSFVDDPRLTTGVLWGMAEVARKKRALVQHYTAEILPWLDSPDRQIRTHAWWALYCIDPRLVLQVEASALGGKIYWQGELVSPAVLQQAF
ncbi:MAG: DVU0298 family protein [Desulfurispora sp.]|uniref:DVU0298 family protein n=1 Tax=Desulfurispora sp. TaxID=3014275 RepID=UPI00404907E6